MPKRQPKRRRLWLNDGACVRLRAERPNHVWSYDFVMDRTHDGRPLKMLTLVDEFTRECPAMDVERHIKSDDVLHRLTEVFVERGTPDHIRSDNGPEFVAKAVTGWLADLNVDSLFIEPGSPWENRYVESFNGKLRDEMLNMEVFDTLLEAKVMAVADRVQHVQAAQLAGLQAAGTGGRSGTLAQKGGMTIIWSGTTLGGRAVERERATPVTARGRRRGAPSARMANKRRSPSTSRHIRSTYRAQGR